MWCSILIIYCFLFSIFTVWIYLISVIFTLFTYFMEFALYKYIVLLLLLFNVVVPSKSKLTVVTCNWTRAINQIQTTRDGVNGGTLPCVWLAHDATSSDSVTNNLTYLPNDTQHVLDRTRVSVCKQCSKVMKKQQAWGKSLRRLNCTTQ